MVLKEKYCTRRSCKNMNCKYNSNTIKHNGTIEYTVLKFYGTDKCKGFHK